MKISTYHVYPPIPIRQYDWCAVDDETYDGAPDSATRNQIGYGTTPEEAIADLRSILEEEE